MRRITRIVTVFGIVLPMLASCKAISGFLDEGEVVAKAGGASLMMSELQKVIPDGISSEDSIAFARQYINSWALDQIFLDVAESQLSSSELDVSKELEAYRRSLLKYRYEQLYVNERLDTAVSDDKVEEYYAANKDRFVLQRPVVKARFLLIASDSPSLSQIRKKMASEEVQDLIDADSLAYSSALKFMTWNNEWLDAVSLAREFGMDHTDMLRSMNGKWIEQKDTAGMLSLAYISDMIRAGEMAPIDYCTPSIKDMIISSRKQSLITSLERDLLNDARENGQFVIY